MKPLQVAAGLVFRNGLILITQRQAEDHLGGLWEFPGGKCEPGESYPEAVRRELREELGIEVVVGDRFESIDHAYPDRTVHLEFFVCRWLAHEPQALGCAQFQWIGPDALEDYRFPAADTRLLTRLRATRAVWRFGAEPGLNPRTEDSGAAPTGCPGPSDIAPPSRAGRKRRHTG